MSLSSWVDMRTIQLRVWHHERTSVRVADLSDRHGVAERETHEARINGSAINHREEGSEENNSVAQKLQAA